MMYTPLKSMTNEELSLLVLSKSEPTWEEIELVHRLELLENQLAAYAEPQDIYGVPV